MPHTTPALEYLTYEQASARYGLSHFSLRRMAAAGRLTRHRSALDSRRVLLSRAELDRELHADAMNVPKD